MATTHSDPLYPVLASYKAVFWHENNGLPESEIDQLWQVFLNSLFFRLGTQEQHDYKVPCKRFSPRTMSFSGHPPSKRQELVGPLRPCPHPWSDRIFRACQRMPSSDNTRPRLK